MKRLLLTVVACMIGVSLLQAKDEVSVRLQEKPLLGKISGESAKGVVLDGKTIAPEEIVDIFYDLPTDLKFGGPYSSARKEEKDSLDPAKDAAKRAAHIREAIKKYDETYAKAADKAAKRHMKYKVAALTTRLALEAGDPIDKAVAALVEFKKTYPASWQIVPALQSLAQLHVGKGEFKEAIALLEELTTFDIAEETRLDAEIQAASVSIRAKMADAALAKLQKLHAKLAKGSRQALRAEIAIGECYGAQGKTDEAIGLLRGIIGGTADRGLKAAAYNALGETFMKKEKYKEALWEFLWVDVVYNQDRVEHARALFRLAETFESLGEADRALQCRELLAGDREFAGLEYQRLAQAELGGAKTKTKSK